MFVAEASLNSHIMGSRLAPSVSIHSGHGSSRHIDTLLDQRSKKALVETLQQFYFVGVLIALAIVHDQPIRVKLPILFFRILKSYRPTATAISPSPGRDDFDPTASSFTAGTTSPTAEEGRQSVFSCHFMPTLEDLREKGADAAVDRAELIRSLDYADFDRLLDHERVPLDTTKETYIRDFVIEPNVITPSLRVYIDATFIALADSGVIRSVIWQLSSPAELRDMCCA